MACRTTGTRCFFPSLQQRRAFASKEEPVVPDRDVEIKKSEKQMVALLRRIADAVSGCLVAERV
jgi:hypothetical protein